MHSFFATVSIVFLAFAMPQAGFAQSTEMPGVLNLTGEGQVAAVPDQATLVLGVVTEADTAADALAENSARLAAVFAVLDASGIAAEDRQTSGLSIQPVWQHQRGDNPPPPRIVGYSVANTLTVLVRDLGNLGAVLDAVVRDGANSFQSLSFGVADAQPLEDAARIAAVEDAVRKAQLYTQALGVGLGKIQSANELGRVQPMMIRAEAAFAMADGGMPVPIAEGQVTFTAQVSITWELVQ